MTSTYAYFREGKRLRTIAVDLSDEYPLTDELVDTIQSVKDFAHANNIKVDSPVLVLVPKS